MDCWLIEEKALISPEEISQRRLGHFSPVDSFLQFNRQGIFPSENLPGWPNSGRTDIYPSRIRQHNSPWVLSQNQVSKINPKRIFQIQWRGCCQKPSTAFLPRSLKCKHGFVESFMQIPGRGKRKIGLPPPSAKMKCWQQTFGMSMTFLSWNPQCRWRFPSQQQRG